MTWTPTPLPPHLEQRGGDPTLVGKELLSIITHAIVNQPRSLQKRIGPSEIGHPCPRRIGYKLLDAPEFNHQVNWKAYIGTAMHAQLETVFDQWNLDHCPTYDHAERFLVESKVCAGEANGEDIEGHTDLYDRATATVIDWKVVGPNNLKKYKRHGPGAQYRTQGHSYGRGWARLGLPVDHVMIVFLPRNTGLHDTYIWHEPYDEQVAIDGFNRVNAIADTTRALGVGALAVLPTADAWCNHCDYFKANSTDLVQGCPGDPASQTAPPPALTLSR